MNFIMGWLYILVTIIFILAMTCSVCIFIIDQTEIGTAIRDYILSKIIEEKGEKK